MILLPTIITLCVWTSGEDSVKQSMQGVKVYLSSQCTSGDLQPELYRAGSAALNMGVEGGPQMTPEVFP